MKEGDEIVKCEICGNEMKKKDARSYGQSTLDGRYILHWICPIMESPSCYVELLTDLSTRPHMESLAFESGR